MIRILMVFVLTLIFIGNSYAETNENVHYQRESLHPIFPVFLGAGLITWGAYELGSDAEDGRRNISVLWGSTLVASAGIILYQSTKEKGTLLSLNPTKNKTPALVLNYEF
jgi:hypothetical protein